MADLMMHAGDVLTPEEIHGRGQQWFEQKIQAMLADHRPWDCVAIDVVTGEYETADEPLAAADRLRAKLPQAIVWMRRVGFPYVHRFGFVPRNRPVELRRVPT